jgi:Domain of unknown function (DUF4157)
MTRVLAQAPTVAAATAKSETAVRHDTEADDAEHEADRAADDVMRPQSKFCAVTAEPAAPPAALPDSVARTLREPGTPLDPRIRQDLENKLGHDFSNVRIHTGTAAIESSQDLHAQAYTVGNHIAFGAGFYSPAKPDGQRLLAHELTHVIQQSRSGGPPATSRTLQRKPRTDAGPDGPASVPTVPDTAPPPSMQSAPSPPAAPRPRPPTRLATPARVVQKPRAALTTPGKPLEPPSSIDGNTAGELDNAPDANPLDSSPIPPLSTLLDQPQPIPPDSGPPSGSGATAGAPVGGLTRLQSTLARGSHAAGKTIDSHSMQSLSHLDAAAKRTKEQLVDLTIAADDAARTLADRARADLDTTIESNRDQLRWARRNAEHTAKTYTDNLKTALTDGFASYREALARAFDDWATTFSVLYDQQAAHLDEVTNSNARQAFKMSESYYRDYVASYREQSEERKQDQQDAVSELSSAYESAIRKGQREFLPELAKTCTQARPELDKARDEALVEFDKGLPVLLGKVDTRHENAVADIAFQTAQAQLTLTDAAIKMYTRIDRLEKESIAHNAVFSATLYVDIDSGLSIARRNFLHAAGVGLRPIAHTLNEAAHLLRGGQGTLDESAAVRFVDEIVQFSTAAADQTDSVFVDAREASLSQLTHAIPFAKRGFATARRGLEATFHAESALNETSFIEYGTRIDLDLTASLSSLDASYQDIVSDTDEHLEAMLAQVYQQLNASMDPTVEKIRAAVNNVVIAETQSRRDLWKQMVNAARKAAWRFDHPYLKHVVDTIEVAAGFIAVLAIATAIILSIPFIFGEAAAGFIFAGLAMLGAFLLGYQGAQHYYERKADHQTVAASFFGALADVTGITDAYHAFTDFKMAPFDRGMAWGGFWLNLLGAAEAAPKLLRAIKVRLPKSFSNPFRLSESSLPGLLPGEGTLPALPESPPSIPVARKIGFELPGAPATEGEIPVVSTAEPRRIGFELPHEDVPVTRPPETVAKAPKQQIGFRPPGEQSPPLFVDPGPREYRPVKGFGRDDLAPTQAPTSPLNTSESPASVLADMPPAQQIPGSSGPTLQTTNAAKAPIGEPAAPASGAPTKGSFVSTVEPELPAVSPASEPAPAQPKPPKQTVEEWIGLGNEPKQGTYVPPKKEITASPRPANDKLTMAEQLGDPEDALEVKSVHSDNAVGFKPPPRGTTKGNMAHNELPGHLSKMLTSNDAHVLEQASKLQEVLHWPPELEPNHLAFEMSDGRQGIPDALEPDTSSVYEFKPDTETKWAKRGQYQAQEYANQLNKERYLGKTDWHPEVITYDAAGLDDLMVEWGMLEPPPHPDTVPVID